MKKNRSRKISILLSVMLLITQVIGGFPARLALAEEGPALLADVVLQPAKSTVDSGEEFDVAIVAHNVYNLHRASISLNFDPARVEVVPLTAVGPVQPGDIFDGHPDRVNAFVYNNQADNSQGTLRFTYSLAEGQPGVTVGDGGAVIGTFKFKAKAPGSVPLDFDPNYTEPKPNPAAGFTVLVKMRNPANGYIHYNGANTSINIQGDQQPPPPPPASQLWLNPHEIERNYIIQDFRAGGFAKPVPLEVDIRVFDFNDVNNAYDINAEITGVGRGTDDNGVNFVDFVVDTTSLYPGQYGIVFLMFPDQAPEQAPKVFLKVIDPHIGGGGGGGGSGNIWSQANLLSTPDTRITGNPVLDVGIGDFQGEASNLSLGLWFEGPGFSELVTTLSSVDYLETTVGQQVYRFTALADEALPLADQVLDGYFLKPKLVYSQEYPAENIVQALFGVKVDNQPPGEVMWANFDKKAEEGEHQGKYRIKVGLEDDFSTAAGANTLVVDNFILLRWDEAAEILSEVPDEGKAVVPFYEDWQQSDSPYRYVYVYLSQVQPGDILRVQNLADIAGHGMSNAVDFDLHVPQVWLNPQEIDVNSPIPLTVTAGGFSGPIDQNVKVRIFDSVFSEVYAIDSESIFVEDSMFSGVTVTFDINTRLNPGDYALIFQNPGQTLDQGEKAELQLTGELRLPEMEVTVGHQAATALYGLNPVAVKVRNAQVSANTEFVEIAGQVDNGTTDPGDDLNFILKLEETFAQGEFAANVQLVAGSVYYSESSNTIPVNILDVNHITLSYPANGSSQATAELTWSPAYFDWVDQTTEDPPGGLKLRLQATGMTGPSSDRIVVSGSTSVAGDPGAGSMAFDLVLDKEWPEGGTPDSGNYGKDVQFVNKNEFTEQDFAAHPQQIPVVFGQENTIIFTYSQGEVMLATYELAINPGSGPGQGDVNIWDWANLKQPESGGNTWISENPLIDIVVAKFQGELAKLRVDLVYQEGALEGTIVATLSGVEDISGADQQTGTNLFRFAAIGAEAGALAGEDFNDRQLQVKLVYDDPEKPKDTQAGWVQVDNRAPGEVINVNFDKVEDQVQEHLGKYRFRIELNDLFSTNSLESGLVPDNFTVYRSVYQIADPEKAVVPYYNSQWEEESNQPYRSTYLYLSDVRANDTLQIKNLRDMVGHTLQEPVVKTLMLGTTVSGAVYQNNGLEKVPNANLILIPYDDISGLKLDQKQYMFTGDDGQFYSGSWLPMGTYFIPKVSYNYYNEADDQYYWNEVYVGQFASIPARGSDQGDYELTIILPPGTPNLINGKVKRATEDLYQETLVFVNKSLLSGIPGEMELEGLIYETGITVQTADDGSFSFYLPPGEYKLIGRNEGMTLTEPVTPVEFTVPESGIVDLEGVLIRFPDPNVFGVLRDKFGPVDYAGLGIIGTDGSNKTLKKVQTDHEGNFSLALADGNYQMQVARVNAPPPDFGNPYEQPDQVWLSVYAVDEGYQEPLVITAGGFGFPLSNDLNVGLNTSNWQHVEQGIVARQVYQAVYAEDIAVKLELAGGLAAGKYFITFQNPETGEQSQAKFTVTKPGEGAPGVRNAGLFYLDVFFQVQDGELVIFGGSDLQPGSTADSLQVKLPAPNVTVKLAKGGIPVTEEGRLVIRQGEQKLDVIGRGVFDFYFLPGTELNPAQFTFEEVELWGYNWRRVVLNETIAVGPFTDLTGDKAVILDLQGSANVVVKFFDDSGNSTGSDYSLGIEKEGSWEYIWTTANANGEVYLQLKPGKYKINGYDAGGSWREVRQAFAVTLENNKHNQVIVNIIVQEPNFTGVVHDDSGNPLAYAWVNLRKLPLPGELFSKHYGFNTDEFGQFTTILEPGDYVIEGVGTGEKWYELNLKLTIENGVKYTDYVIAKPADNVSGKVFKSYTDEDSFEEYPGDIYQQMGLELERTDVEEAQFQKSPWLYRKWVKVNDDGTFGVFLDEGDAYAVRAVTTHKQYFEFDTKGEYAIKFTVGTDSTGLIVAPPKPNFSGIVQDFAGNLITRGWLNVEKADWTEWHWIQLDSDGSFGKALQAGAEYNIREVNYYDADQWNDQWNGPEAGAVEHRLTLNKKVVIGQTSEDLVLTPNVKGTLGISGMDMGDIPDWGISVIIRPDKDWLEMTDDERMNPWKYEQQANLEVDLAAGKGIFYTYLHDGAGQGQKYLLAGIPAQNKWIELNEQFTIGNPPAAKYDLNFDLTQNVTGAVYQANGTPVANVWVDFREVLGPVDFEQGKYERYFGTSTDSSGQFALKLKEGTYRLNGINTQGKWVGKQWQPGTWTEVGYNFKVDAVGQLTTMDGSLLPHIVVRPNLTGSVKNYYRAGDDKNGFVESNPAAGDLVTLKYGWMTIKPATGDDFKVNMEDWNTNIWANSGEKGIFNLMLAPGKYKVVEAGGMNFWMPLDIRLAVDGAGTVSVDPAGYLDAEGKLVIKPEAPNVKGYVFRSYIDAVSNTPVNRGWLAIKPALYKDWQWDEQVRWVEVKKGGYFETRLPDGEWKIAEVNSSNYWFKYDVKFTVSGDIITSTQPGLVVGGQLHLAPPENNFKGVVQEKGGNQVNQNVWITVKPAAAGEYDWEGSFGFEAKNGSFSTFVKPGGYKVTNMGSHNFWFDVNIPFVIEDDLSVTIAGNYWDELKEQVIIKERPANVVGTVYAPDGETKLSNGWLGIARFDAGGQQVKMTGEVISAGEMNKYELVQWQFTRGFGTKDDGVFAATLDETASLNHQYRILHVNGMVNGLNGNSYWVNYDPKLNFTVPAEGNVELAVKEPQANTTIRITGAVTQAGEGWLDLVTTKGGKKVFIPIPFKQKTAEGVFEFAANLDEGQYVVQSFGTYDFFKEIKEPFTLAELADGILAINLQAGGLKVVKGDVAGGSSNTWVNIQKVITDNGQDILSSSELDQRKITADDAGMFSFELKAGTTWAVTGVNTTSGYKAIANPLSTTLYTVGEDIQQSPANWQNLAQ